MAVRYDKQSRTIKVYWQLRHRGLVTRKDVLVAEGHWAKEDKWLMQGTG